MESVKSNKEKDDHSTGLKLPQVKGTGLFDVPLSAAAVYDKQFVWIMTDDEKNRLSNTDLNLSEIFTRQDNIMALSLEIARTVGTMLEKKEENAEIEK
jgi:hypothetical protein